MKTLVLGASNNPGRYSYLAIKTLLSYNHDIIAVGKTGGEVEGVPILKEVPMEEKIDTITLYLNPGHQKLYYDKILALKPRRIIYNPGAENAELVELAKKAGIENEYACTLVMLNTGQY